MCVPGCLSEEEEAKSEILIVNEEKRKAVLQTQLAFFRNILNITCSARLFNKTKLVGSLLVRFDLSWRKLFENFVEVLKAFRIPQNQVRVEAEIIRLDERKVIVEHKKKQLMDEISSARLEGLNNLQVNSTIKKFIENPELLVRISIQHRVRENNGVDAAWCRANVVGVDKINRSNLKRTSFDFVHDGKRDDVFSFPLILD